MALKNERTFLTLGMKVTWIISKSSVCTIRNRKNILSDISGAAAPTKKKTRAKAKNLGDRQILSDESHNDSSQEEAMKKKNLFQKRFRL